MKGEQMQKQSRQRVLAAIFAAALMSLAGAAMAYDDATALTGTVVSVNHDLNYVTVRDDVTGKTFKVDTRAMNTRNSINVWNLRAGDRLSATGSWENNETYKADRVMNAAANPHAMTRMANAVTGTVEDVNRDLNYIVVRDQVTNQPVRIDVRKMDTRRSVNVWDLRNGDLVTTHGTWAKNGRFRANFVNFGNNIAPMASSINVNSPNMVTGVVQSVNRDLNYFTVRDDSGRSIKVDVRQMDTRRSVNVWNLRAGDRISVDGSWAANGDRFQAEMVRF
jgi:hypothetical protein